MTRKTLAQCGEAQEAKGEFKTVVIIFQFPFQFELFLVLGVLLVCLSSFAFLCSLGPLTRRFLVPLGDFCLHSGFHGSFLCGPSSVRICDHLDRCRSES